LDEGEQYPLSVKNFLFDETIDPSRHRLLVANGELSDVRKNTFADRAWTPKTPSTASKIPYSTSNSVANSEHAIRKEDGSPESDCTATSIVNNG